LTISQVIALHYVRIIRNPYQYLTNSRAFRIIVRIFQQAPSHSALRLIFKTPSDDRVHTNRLLGHRYAWGVWAAVAPWKRLMRLQRQELLNLLILIARFMTAISSDPLGLVGPMKSSSLSASSSRP
jgi:hypothetical protein